MQKEVQEKGFTKPNVDQLLAEVTLEKMSKFDIFFNNFCWIIKLIKNLDFINCLSREFCAKLKLNALTILYF